MDSLDDYQIPYGLMAEFDTPADVLNAAEKVRDAGYTRWDAHSPFPVHGLDSAMGPWIVSAWRWATGPDAPWGEDRKRGRRGHPPPARPARVPR